MYRPVHVSPESAVTVITPPAANSSARNSEARISAYVAESTVITTWFSSTGSGPGRRAYVSRPSNRLPRTSSSSAIPPSNASRPVTAPPALTLAVYQNVPEAGSSLMAPENVPWAIHCSA